MCDQCGKIVSTPNTLCKHLKTVHGIKTPKTPIQCKHCHNWYAGKVNLQKHISNIHASNEDKRNVCEICGFVSTTKEAKMKHKRVKHRPGKNFDCTICGRSFQVPILLKVSFVF